MLKDALLKIEKKLDTLIDAISVCDFRYENPIFDAPKQCKELMFSKILSLYALLLKTLERTGF